MEEENEEYPITVKELRDWYMALDLPPEEESHFYIGKDVTYTNAIGIYRNVKDNLVVFYEIIDDDKGRHKHIIYEGPNEEYAVKTIKAMIEEKYLKNKFARIWYKAKEVVGSRDTIIALIVYFFIALAILAVAIDAVFFH